MDFWVFRLSCGRWHRRPSPGGVRLTVSRSLTEAQRHRGAAAVENKLGEEPMGSELSVALSGLGIPQA